MNAAASAALAVLHLLRPEADRPVQVRLAAALLVVCAASALSAAAPLALRELIDALPLLQANADSSRALVAGSLYALALCGARLMAELRPCLTSAVELRLSGGVRLRFFAHLLHLPLAFHHQHRSGSLVQTVNQAAVGVRTLVSILVGGVMPVLIEIACIAIVLVSLGQPALTVCFLLRSLAYLALLLGGAPRLSARSRDVVRASVGAHAILADHLSHCEAVKCQVAELSATGRLAAATAGERTCWSQLHRHRAWLGIGGVAVFGVALATSLLLAGRAVTTGTLTLGGFVLTNVYILQIVRPLEALGAGMRDLIQAVEWLRPTVDILRLPTEDVHPTSPTIQPEAVAAVPTSGVQKASNRAPSLSVRRLSFAHGPDRALLHDIQLDVASGRTLAIVGASGSGKSSLLRLILRLYEPQHGAILLDGRPVHSIPPSDLRRTIGFVPQEASLLHDTLAANISLGDDDAPRAAILHAARLAGLDELIAALPQGCDTLVGERGFRLSGGERQRVAIARALLKAPLLLLFDEATSMLDSATEATVMRNIRAAAAGCTMVIAAHRLSTVVHADEIVVLDAGAIVERGTHVQLLAAKGRYARLWRLQHAAGRRVSAAPGRPLRIAASRRPIA